MDIVDALTTAITGAASSTTAAVADNMTTIVLIFGALVGVQVVKRLWGKFIGRKA